MVEDGGAKLFSVVFYDGESEVNIGKVKIHPSLDYKSFQSLLSQKIGISPNQMSIYLVDKSKSKLSHEDRRKTLITGRANFALIAREKDCVILVVLKRSRRDRRRKSKQNNAEYGDVLAGNNFFPTPEKFILLRRNMPDPMITQFPGFVSPTYNPFVPVEFENFSNQFQNLQIQRDNYMGMIPNSNLYSSFPEIGDFYDESPALPFCEECVNAKMQRKAVPFHCCVNDAVTVAFRSPAGPIARPSIDSL